MKKSLIILFVIAFFVIFGASFKFFQTGSQLNNKDALAKISYSDYVAKLIQAHSHDTPVYGYQVVNVYPHDSDAFTQGLIFDKGFLYESTGLRGKSTLRKVNLETGKALHISYLSSRYFGEGLTLWQEKLFQLTWKSGVAFVYNKKNFRQIMKFTYPTEGWGITQDGTFLIMSDGTATLRFLDPETFAEVRRIEVRNHEIPIFYLNELEHIKGEIYANVWQTDYIARISPETGQVVGWIDLTNLLSTSYRSQRTDVLNGIAFDASNDRIFVTGKRWPILVEILLIL
jgi:glutamine cyclotransferase